MLGGQGMEEAGVRERPRFIRDESRKRNAASWLPLALDPRQLCHRVLPQHTLPFSGALPARAVPESARPRPTIRLRALHVLRGRQPSLLTLLGPRLPLEPHPFPTRTPGDPNRPYLAAAAARPQPSSPSGADADARGYLSPFTPTFPRLHQASRGEMS